MPYLEHELKGFGTGTDRLATVESDQRVIKTHLTAELLKDNLDKHPSLKIILLLRNPKDTLVSYYHHYR